MATEQKHNQLLEKAESRLRQLSPEKLELVVTFLAYLQNRKKNEATEELLTIPSFASSFHETETNQGKSDHTDSNLIAQDAEVWQAYLASKQKWQEVYRRLADS